MSRACVSQPGAVKHSKASEKESKEDGADLALRVSLGRGAKGKNQKDDDALDAELEAAIESGMNSTSNKKAKVPTGGRRAAEEVRRCLTVHTARCEGMRSLPCQRSHPCVFAVQSRVIVAVTKGDARVERDLYFVVTRSSAAHTKTRIDEADLEALLHSLDGENEDSCLPEPLAVKYGLSLDVAIFTSSWFTEYAMHCAASTGSSAPPRIVFHDLADAEADAINIPKAVISWKFRDGPSLLSVLAVDKVPEDSLRIAQRNLLMLAEDLLPAGDMREVVRHRAERGIELAMVLSRFQKRTVVTRSFAPSLIIVPDGDCSKAWVQCLSRAGLSGVRDGVRCGDESSKLVCSHWWYSNPPAKEEEEEEEEGDEEEEIKDPELVQIGTALGVEAKLLRQPPDIINHFVFDSMGLGLTILMLLSAVPMLDPGIIDSEKLRQRLLTFWSNKVRPARVGCELPLTAVLSAKPVCLFASLLTACRVRS